MRAIARAASRPAQWAGTLAMRRRATLGEVAVETAEAFYRHHGFTGFGSQPRQLFLPLSNLAKKS